MSNPTGNPNIKNYGFKTDRVEPLTAKLSMRVTNSMLAKLKEQDNWQELVREAIAEKLQSAQGFPPDRKTCRLIFTIHEEHPMTIITIPYLHTKPWLIARVLLQRFNYCFWVISLSQQELKDTENTPLDQLKKNKAVEKDIVQELDRLIQEQGLSDTRNSQLELLGFQDGVVNKRAQEKFWSNYAYKKGNSQGTNRFWDKKFGSFPSEGEGL